MPSNDPRFADPERSAADIIDCLTQASRPIAFLLGSGCSSSIRRGDGSPLIPDSIGLTQAVSVPIRKGESSASWDLLINTLTEDGHDNPNIEDVLSRVRGLLEHAGAGEVRGLTRDQLSALETEVCAHVVEQVSAELPEAGTPFHSLAEWIAAMGRHEPVEIFTTNYDLLIERALELSRVPYFDGFAGAREPLFDLYALENDPIPTRWARLWKIHGSINWRRVETPTGFEISRGSVGDSALIHPSHLKYAESRKLPYLAMVDRLRAFLGKPSSVLMICGYSFGDQHLNDVISQGLRGNPTAVVHALEFGDLPNNERARSVGNANPNFLHHAKNGALIGCREMAWIQPREAPTRMASDSAVRWTEPASEGESWLAEFLLGDFLSLGQLLEEIVGRDVPKSRDSDAETPASEQNSEGNPNAG